MDLQAAIYIWENYGWIGLLSLAFGSYVIFERVTSFKKTKKIEELERKVEKLEEEVEMVHDNCHIEPESIDKLYQKVEALEEQDSEMDGDLKAFKAEITAKIGNLEEGQRAIQKDVRSILNHLLNK